MNSERSAELRALLRLTPGEIRERAGERLIVCADMDALHWRMAHDLFTEIAQSAAAGQPLRLILPVGPTNQYPLLAQMLNEQRVRLDHCWFFFMDEYCDVQGRALEADHPLSFKRVARQLFLHRLNARLGLAPERVVFPDEHNIDTLARWIDEAGGIDTCYGGIGIHGHVAFNEPEPDVANLSCRRVRLNDYTVTLNAIRAGVGGALPLFPREAYTLGMREILAARRIRLYCRSGIALDWANAVLRVALFGAPGDDYPVTHIRPLDYTILTDEATLASPQHLI